MKKIAFIVVLIAVVVGMVFGGLSLASAAPRPTPTPTPPPTSGPVYMEIRTGHVVTPADPTQYTVYNENYPQIRHVSLTMNIYGLGGNSTVWVTVKIGSTSPNAVLKEIWFPDGIYTVECDTNALTILASALGSTPTVDYNITTTYPY